MPLLLDGGVDGSMDVDIEVDDLFGDGVGLALQAGPRPPSKPLLQRVDEMRRTGCCRGIAWSPAGTLATISQDGRSVELRFLRSHPDTGDWALSEATVYSPWDQLPQGSSIVHLAWSPAGNPELAIVDSFGRILIAAFNSAANRPMLMRKWESDLLDDMHSVVGSHALMPPIPGKQKITFAYGAAQRKGTNITYPVVYVPHMGPNHVFPAKSAFVFVTANGTLKVLWSQLNNRYEEKTLELESITSGDDSVTHASICSNRGMLLIALATASRQLRVVRVNVTWASSPNQTDKQHPPQVQLRLDEKHVAVTNWLQTGSGESSLDSSMAQISHIEIIPSICENVHQNKWSSPLVSVVRTYVPSLGSSYTQDKATIVDRWEVCFDQPQVLHSAFAQLASKRGGAGPPTPTSNRLRKLESTVFQNKVLLDMSLSQHGKVMTLVFSDGTVQHRDSATFNELYKEQASDGISNLNELGFTFAEETPCLQAAFSPSRFSFAQICEDGKVKWNLAQYSEDIGSSMNDDMYANIIAVLAVSISNCSLLSQTFDDVLAVARNYTNKERFCQELSMEVIKCLRVTVDYAEDSHQDKLLSNNHIVTCCSVMAHLDFHGYFKARTFANKLATVTLHTKNIILNITMASNAYTQQNTAQRGVTPLDDPYIVDVLTGCGEWIRDLISWIVDGLYNLLDDTQFMNLLQQEKTMPEMVKHLISRSDVSLHLCLCSMTRVLLGAACRRLEHLQTVSTRAMTHFERPSSKGETQVSIALCQAYKRMHSALSESLVKWADFETLLSTLGSEIQTAYKTELASIHKTGQAQSSEDTVRKARTQCELLLLLGLPPPSYFQPIIEKFFKTHLQQFRLGMRPSDLFFADYSLVEMADDDKALAKRRQKGLFVDTFRRNKVVSPLVLREKERKAQKQTQQRQPHGQPQGTVAAAAARSQQQAQMPWRRCTRCSCVMVDVQINRQNIQYMLSQLKKCACGGNWAILPKDSMVF